MLIISSAKLFDHTLKKLKKDLNRKIRAMFPARNYSMEFVTTPSIVFGPMTLTLMEHWNIQKCRDFGDIVFNLVDFGILGRTENDSLEDFEGGYSFEEAFELPFQPKDLEKN